jgi:putative lipoprotein
MAAACTSPVALPQIAARIVERVPAPEPPRVVSARYACDETILLVAFFADHLVLAEPEGEVILQRAPSISGAFYVNGDRIFFNKGGGEATLEKDDEILMCRELPDPWRNAGSRGIDFRAVGQEPGWFVEIDDERLIHLVYDYAGRELTTRAPSKSIEADRTVFTGEAGEQVVRVAIEERRCADVMSGEPYPYTVTVTVDDRELKGCGRLVVPK